MEKSFKYVIFVTILLLSKIAFCQNSTIADDPLSQTFNYTLQVEAPVKQCDISGNIIEGEIQKAAPAGAEFTLIGKKGDSVIIRFWIWKTDAMKKAFNYTDESKTQRKYFLLALYDFNFKAIKRYKSWFPTITAGTVIVPVKLRFKQFDFSKDITIGPTVGAKFRMSNYTESFMNVLFGFGITSVTLDSFSTKGAIKGVSDRPALTPSLGILFEFNQVQIGIFSGLDYISKKENLDWRYQGKPWLSIGLGYSILSRSANVTEKKNQNNTQED